MRFAAGTRDTPATHRAVLNFLGLEDKGRREFPQVHGARRHRSDALADLAQWPARLYAAAAQAVKRATGLKSLKLGSVFRKVNWAEDYGTNVDDALRAEIRTFFAEDNRALPDLLARHGVRQMTLGGATW